MRVASSPSAGPYLGDHEYFCMKAGYGLIGLLSTGATAVIVLTLVTGELEVFRLVFRKYPDMLEEPLH